MSPEASPPTPDDMSQVFWLVFGTLDQEVQDALTRWWSAAGDQFPVIETDPDRFQGEVAYLGSNGIIFEMRIPKLLDRKHSLLRLIYHELAHAYLAAVGNHPIDDYNRRRIHYESGATKLEKRFTDNLKASVENRTRLRNDPLIDRLSFVFDFSPLYIGERVYAQRTPTFLSLAVRNVTKGAAFATPFMTWLASEALTSTFLYDWA